MDFDLKELVGRTILGVHSSDGYVLFADGESYLSFREQDRYDFHDCCYSARIVDLHKDKKRWQEIEASEGFISTLEILEDMLTPTNV